MSLYVHIDINPFTAPACKISGVERCTDVPANSIVLVLKHICFQYYAFG